jgi:hypothetical protein
LVVQPLLSTLTVPISLDFSYSLLLVSPFTNPRSKIHILVAHTGTLSFLFYISTVHKGEEPVCPFFSMSQHTAQQAAIRWLGESMYAVGNAFPPLLSLSNPS